MVKVKGHVSIIDHPPFLLFPLLRFSPRSKTKNVKKVGQQTAKGGKNLDHSTPKKQLFSPRILTDWPGQEEERKNDPDCRLPVLLVLAGTGPQPFYFPPAGTPGKKIFK